MEKVYHKFIRGKHGDDAEIERAFERLKDVLSSVKHLQSSFASLQRVSSSLRDMSSRASGCIMTMRDPQSPVIDVYAKLDDVSKYVNENLPEKMNSIFERVVMEPLNNWRKEFASLEKNERLGYMEAKLLFDHYTAKMRKLRDSKHQKEMKGKRVGGRAANKISRNAEKLEKAERVKEK